jgi:hypothetical protein
MLHIATVHFNSPRWIEIQARHLREHLSVPYRTWTSLQGIDSGYGVHFDRVLDQAGSHAGKLNHLATEISHEAQDDDLLMFLDGDAFPVADPMPMILEALGEAPLLAVRRDENLGDIQPHPCFCVTTVGTWRTLPGDWSTAYRWKDVNGRGVSDVGGNLLRTLELTNTTWVPVLRSNTHNIDPLMFAVYGGVVYHHGAGFRDDSFRGHFASPPDRIPVPPVPIAREVVRGVNRVRGAIWYRKLRRESLRQSREMFERIRRGDAGWLSQLV